MVFRHVVINGRHGRRRHHDRGERAPERSSGGTIRYSDNTNAEIKHDAVAASTDHKVEGRGASVTAVEFTNLPSTASYVTIGDSIDVKLTFNRPVTVDVTNGTPRIELAPAFGYNDVTEMNDVVRYAAYRGGSGGKALVFTYEVQDRDNSTGDGFVRVAANKLTAARAARSEPARRTRTSPTRRRLRARPSTCGGR